MWVGVGAALGAGGSLWARRRVGLLTERMRSGALAGDVAAIADRGARGRGPEGPARLGGRSRRRAPQGGPTVARAGGPRPGPLSPAGAGWSCRPSEPADQAR